MLIFGYHRSNNTTGRADKLSGPTISKSIQCLNQIVFGLYFAGLETKFNLTLKSMRSLIGFQNANKEGYTCTQIQQTDVINK